MKQLLPFFLLALLTLSCQTKPTQPSAQDGISLEFDSLLYQDSALIHGTDGHRVTYRTVWPKGPASPLLDSLSAWICEQFGDTLHLCLQDLPKLIEGQGKQALLDGYAELTSLVEDRDLEDDDEDTYYPNYEYLTEVTKIYEDDEVITLQCLDFLYLAGAHGSTYIEGATFSKADGHRLDWELVKGYSEQELRTELLKGLKAYFEVDAEAPNSDELLHEQLMLYADITAADLPTRLPLPAFAPWLTEQGVVLLYQQYEIAPYVWGMPECVVPRK